MILKRNLLTLAVASILMSGTHAAFAADTPANAAGNAASNSGNPDQSQATTPADDSKKDKSDTATASLGEVKVTGVRAAVEKAISIKKNSNEIVEVISAEDIGKLPDNSIADALARLPGISAQYVNGVASLLSIRGFSGDFNGTTVNGREQVSTADNRAVDFSQYPAEVMSGVVVYKTPEASLIGQGISGTIDLTTFRPLDFDKRVISVGGLYDTQSNSSLNADNPTKGGRYNVSYIDQYFDHTLGLYIGYEHLDQPVQGERWESYGYTTTPATGSAQVDGGDKVYADSYQNKRDTLITTLQWQPVENYLSTLDLYYSKDKQPHSYGGFEVGTAYGGATLLNPVIQNGSVVGGVWQGVQPVFREEYDANKNKIYTVGWNNKFKFGNGWTATADLSYQKANVTQSLMEQYGGLPGQKDSFAFSTNPNSGIPFFDPALNYNDPTTFKLSDPGGWGQDGYLKDLKVTDELKAARFDLARDIDSPISKVQAGLNYSDRTKTRGSNEWFLDLPGGHTSSITVPTNCLTSSTFLGYAGFPNTIGWNMNCTLSSYQQIPNINADITAKNWLVEEKVGTFYIQANIDTEVAGLPLRGNIGAQEVHTNQHSDAYANTGEAQTTGGATYNNFLPDMNLILTLPDDYTARFSAGKQMVRSRLDNETASAETSISVPPPLGGTLYTTCAPTGVKCLWTGNGGNPELRPFLADAYDLSFEKYWETKSVVQADVWYKKLLTYVYTQSVLYDFAAHGVPDPSPTLTPASSVGTFSQPVNGQGGYMRGYELSATQSLDTLSEALDGFGVQASYAFTQSSISPNGPGTSSPFPGLSKFASTLTAYYDKDGFSARVSSTHRSQFLGEVQAFGANQAFVNIKKATYTDVQLSYAIQSGQLEGVNFLLQVQNIFNTPYQQFYATPAQPEQYTSFGRHILLGASYKF
jgi:iron complex outermembrane receptor protein